MIQILPIFPFNQTQNNSILAVSSQGLLAGYYYQPSGSAYDDCVQFNYQDSRSNLLYPQQEFQMTNESNNFFGESNLNCEDFGYVNEDITFENITTITTGDQSLR